MTRELPGQAPEEMGKHTMTSCLKPEFLARDPYLDPKPDADKMAARQAKCSISDYERQGHQARWRMQCETADGSELDARIDNSASAKTLNMLMTQDVKRAGGGQGRVAIRMQGRHVGPCKPGMMTPE